MKNLNIHSYGSEYFNCNVNKEMPKATFKFLKISERFNGTFFFTILKKCLPLWCLLFVYILVVFF